MEAEREKDMKKFANANGTNEMRELAKNIIYTPGATLDEMNADIGDLFTLVNTRHTFLLQQLRQYEKDDVLKQRSGFLHFCCRWCCCCGMHPSQWVTSLFYALIIILVKNIVVWMFFQ